MRGKRGERRRRTRRNKSTLRGEEGTTDFLAKAKELGSTAEIYWAEGQPHGFFNKSPWMERTLQRADEFLASLGYLKEK